MLMITLVVIISVPIYFLVFATNIFGKQTPHVAHKITIAASKAVFIFYLIRVRVMRKPTFDPEKTFVFISNHTSLLDVPACALVTPGTFRYLAKEELTKVPLFGYIIRKLYLSVNRKDEESRARSMNNMLASLKDGISIFIFPEGTRNKTDQPLAKFYDGAFRLSLETNTPIVPMTILNSKKLLWKFQLRPGYLDCYWGEPIYPLTGESIESLKEKAQNQMMKYLLHQ